MSANVTRAHLSDAVYRRHGGLTRREARQAVNAVFDCLRANLLRGRTIRITHFGVFEVVSRAGRTGVAPGTGRPIEIPAGKALSFRPAPRLKERVDR